MAPHIERDILDWILADQGVSPKRIATLKIDLRRERGPLVDSNRLLARAHKYTIGRYLASPQPDCEGGEEIILWLEGISGKEELSAILAHECGHMITYDGVTGNPLAFLLAFLRSLPPWIDPGLLWGGALSIIGAVVLAATAGLGKIAPVLSIAGMAAIWLVKILPILCKGEYQLSPWEIAAQEKAEELLEDPRWDSVICPED